MSSKSLVVLGCLALAIGFLLYYLGGERRREGEIDGAFWSTRDTRRIVTLGKTMQVCGGLLGIAGIGFLVYSAARRREDEGVAQDAAPSRYWAHCAFVGGILLAYGVFAMVDPADTLLYLIWADEAGTYRRNG